MFLCITILGFIIDLYSIMDLYYLIWVCDLRSTVFDILFKKSRRYLPTVYTNICNRYGISKNKKGVKCGFLQFDVDKTSNKVKFKVFKLIITKVLINSTMANLLILSPITSGCKL